MPTSNLTPTPRTPVPAARFCATAFLAGWVGLAGLASAPVAHAQVCGDVTDDDLITTTDALRVLKAAVGQDVELICTDQCAALETRLAALETLLANLTIDGDNLVLTGMNFQVVSGSGTTNGTVNGKGNIILGYNESNNNQDKRTGSHDLVVGRYHSYSSYGGILAGEDNQVTGKSASVLGGATNIASGDGSVVVSGQGNEASEDTSVVVAGEDNEASGQSSAVLGGASNLASGDGSVVVSGQDNEARQVSSVIVAGEKNLANARSCQVGSGTLNLCSGFASAVEGGRSNFCTASESVISGGSSRTLNTSLGWLAASLGPLF
jgi:hypothetical protein